MVADRSILCTGFLRSSEVFPDHLALEVEGERLTYRELRQRALSLAATMQQRSDAGETSLTAVFSYRSVTAFAGVLAALLRGHGYVPLSRTFPPERTRTMLASAGCSTLIVDAESEVQLPNILAGIQRQLLIVLPERSEVGSLAKGWPQHTFLGAQDLAPAECWEPGLSQADIAYLLFTSGSTGNPKGVAVSQQSVMHFVDVMVNRYEISEQDRFSQMFDMTFDLSAFDMFVAWERGACLCCPPPNVLINPGKFIQQSQLTVWFSVPSVGIIMKRLGMLKPNRYPRLRWSLFCGEPLTMDLASAWAEAAPHSIVENLYGPTELTIACSLYRWDSESSPKECRAGVVPIGLPYPGMEALIVDEDLREVPNGIEGELLMAGPQVALGYWRDAEKTARGFVIPPGKDRVYYRTGDRVCKPLSGGPMTYIGRRDHQLKVLGHRVEPGEVEAALREEANVESAAVVGWPTSPTGAEGIVAFVTEARITTASMLERLRKRLPAYAVPREIRLLSFIPLNSNGKIDRGALLRMLEREP